MSSSNDASFRAVVGVYEQGFVRGWGPRVPGYPSYRVLNPGGCACIFSRTGDTELAVFQLHCFGHIERLPLPTLRVNAAGTSFTAVIQPGWQTICHGLYANDGPVCIEFSLDPHDDDPWFEIRVVEVSLFPEDDPRIRCPREMIP